MGDAAVATPSLGGHLSICRIDHWTKNVFVLPGMVVALSLEPAHDIGLLVLDALVGLLALGIVASSNYVINELRDAPFDRHHPTKRARPVPSGRVSVPLAYVQWIAQGAAGVALGAWISAPFAGTLVALWVMGCVYNLPPLRTKDLPYLDVLSEGVNNPLRMISGWYIVGPDAFPPASLLLSYWMVGCYFMALKRLAEWRFIRDASRAAAYRSSFAHYDDTALLVSIVFYASTSMLFLGAFIMRYRLSLILAFPLIALVMALYLKLGLRENSPVMNPEQLYRQRPLMLALVACGVTMIFCLFVDLPVLSDLFAPTAPTDSTQ